MDGKLIKDLSKAEKQRLKGWVQQQWEDGLRHFLTLEELKGYDLLHKPSLS
jgi:hypothetical protein